MVGVVVVVEEMVEVVRMGERDRVGTEMIHSREQVTYGDDSDSDSDSDDGTMAIIEMVVIKGKVGG